MIKHVLLIAVLEEMERLEIKLGVLFDKRPEDWEEIYIATRRQIRLCMGELVNLARDDLELSEADAQHLGEVFASFHDQYAGHVARWPIESIDLADPVCVEAFHALREASGRFKSVLYGLVDRYHIKEENT
jgi:hypothetical protein